MKCININRVIIELDDVAYDYIRNSLKRFGLDRTIIDSDFGFELKCTNPVTDYKIASNIVAQLTGILMDRFALSTVEYALNEEIRKYVECAIKANEYAEQGHEREGFFAMTNLICAMADMSKRIEISPSNSR